MTIDDALEAALRTSNRVGELRAWADRLLAAGETSESVLSLLEKARQRLRAEQREQDEDAVMDVMDFVSGWCSPHMVVPTRADPALGTSNGGSAARHPSGAEVGG